MFIDIIPDGWHDQEQNSFKGILETFKGFADAYGLEIDKVGKTQRIVGKAGQDGRLSLDIYAVASLDKITKARSEWLLGDIIETSLILRYPYRYGSGIDVALNKLRLACTNGQTTKVRSNGSIIRHTSSNVNQKIENTMAMILEKHQQQEEDIKVLTETSISQKAAVGLLVDHFGDVNRPANDQPKIVGEMLDRWDAGNFIGSDLTGETAWGLYNLVTEYYNHRYGRSAESNAVVERLIDSTSAVNRSQSKFLESISGFAYAQRERTGAVHIPVSVGLR
jgi:hypothetical protein